MSTWAETGAERDAKLDAARPNGDRIGSGCDIDHGITRRSGRNYSMPTAALAVEAGPLRGKRERTEGMPHRELVQYPVRITVRKYASRCGCSGCSWPLDSSCKLAITWGEAHDANEAPRRSNRRLD